MPRPRVGVAIVAAALAVGCTPAPEPLNVELRPSAPTTLDDLRASAAWTGRGDLTWRWTRDGVPVAVEGDTVPAGLTARGQRWRVTAAVVRGDREIAAGEAITTVRNTAPAATVSLAPGHAGVGLQAAAATTDVDGDPVDLTWSWTRDGASTAFDGPIVPALAPRRGERWQVAVTPHDGEGAGAAAVADVVVANAPPDAVAVTLDPPAPRRGDRPLAQPVGADADGDPLTWRLAWTVDGQDAGGGASPTLGLQRDQRLRVVATPHDGLTDGAPVTREVVVANTPPTARRAAIGGTAREDTPATCQGEGFADADGDAEGWTYAWTVDGQVVPVTTPSLDGAWFQRGQTVGCAALPHDGREAGRPADGGTVVVANTPPTMTGASITPPAPTAGQQLAVIPAGRQDLDGDVVRVSVTWHVNGAIAATTPTLPPGTTRRGDVVVATARPDDGVELGAAVQTPAVVVANTPPTLDAVRLTPDPPHGGLDVIAAAGISDVDGDDVTITWTWRVNGATLPVTGAVLPAGTLAAGDTLEVQATPFDGEDVGDTVSTGPRVVVNAPPLFEAVTVSPSPLTTRDEARCDVVLRPDAEGDDVTVTVAWSVDGLDAGVGATLPPTAFSRGQAVRCVAVATDATGQVSTTPSAPAIVANAAPAVADARLPPGPLTRRDVLVVLHAPPEDPDAGDVVTLRTTWTVDRVVVADTDTLQAPAFARGQRVQATLEASDGVDTVLVQTDAQTISNAVPLVGALTVSPSPPVGGARLVAVADWDDPDGDDVDWRVRWFVDGVEVAEGPDLPAGAVARGQTLEVRAYGDDGLIAGPEVSTGPLLVENTPPTAPAVVLHPPSPTVGGDDLTCVVAQASADNDGDPVTYAVAWTVDGAPWPQPNDPAPRSLRWPGDTVPADALRAGATWRCTVTPADDALDGPSASASTVAVAPALRGVRLGEGLGCAVDAGGAARCWGQDPGGVAALLGRPARAVAVAGADACARDASGALRCAGPDLGRLPPPAGTFTDAAIGRGHGVALRSNGRPVAWGDPAAQTAAVPPGADWVAVVAGDAFACARALDGHATCWGARAPSLPPGSYRALDAGARAACGLREPGELVCAGEPYALTEPPPGRFIALAVGTDTAAAVREDGALVRWGDGAVSEEPGAWAAVDVGADASCAMDTSGAWTCWGGLAAGAHVLPGARADVLAMGPARTCVADDARTWCWGDGDEAPAGAASGLAAGSGFTCAVDAAGVAACAGADAFGQLDAPAGVALRAPVAGDHHACALDPAGLPWCWGDDHAGQASPPVEPLVALAAAADHTCAITAAGALTCWGGDAFGETVAPGGAWSQVSTGPRATCAVAADSTLRCWGDPAGGLLATPAGDRWSAVAVGEAHACAVDDVGAVVCWGDDLFGEATPPALPVVSLAAAPYATCGLLADGELRCWGYQLR